MPSIQPTPQNLQLLLYPNLVLHLMTSNQPMAIRALNSQLLTTKICLIEKEIVDFAGRTVIKKVVIQLTSEEFNCLKKA